MKNKVIIFLCSVSCIISLSAMQNPPEKKTTSKFSNDKNKQPIHAQRFIKNMRKPINDCRYPGSSITK